MMSEKKRKPGPPSLITRAAKDSPKPSRLASSLSRPTLDREAAERLVDAWLAPLAKTTRANYRQGLRRMTAFLADEAAPKAEASPGEGALALLTMTRHEATGTIERPCFSLLNHWTSMRPAKSSCPRKPSPTQAIPIGLVMFSSTFQAGRLEC